MQVSSQIHNLVVLTLSSQQPLETKLGGAQNQSGHGCKKKNPCSYQQLISGHTSSSQSLLTGLHWVYRCMNQLIITIKYGTWSFLYDSKAWILTLLWVSSIIDKIAFSFSFFKKLWISASGIGSRGSNVFRALNTSSFCDSCGRSTPFEPKSKCLE